MEEIPIIVGGETVGRGSFTREGAYVRFTGRLPLQPSLTRLWLYSGGEPYYLGVPMPEGESSVITKRLSRSDFQRLTPPITHCGDAPGKVEAAPEEPEEAAEPDTLWYVLPDGSLQTVENGRTLLAFPLAESGFSTENAPLVRTIEGKRYMVFPW